MKNDILITHFHNFNTNAKRHKTLFYKHLKKGIYLNCVIGIPMKKPFGRNFFEIIDLPAGRTRKL